MAQRRKLEVPIPIPIPDFDSDKPPDVSQGFHKAANELTKLYQQALSYQQSSFESGRKNSLARAYDWILSQAVEGKELTSAEIMTYLENEIDKFGSTSRRPQLEISHHRSGSSQMSREAQVEANSASSSSTTAIGGREPDENASYSAYQAMDEDP